MIFLFFRSGMIIHPYSLIVKSGLANIQVNHRMHRTLDIEKLYRHPMFNHHTYKHDIGLLKITHPIDFSEPYLNVRPIKLATRNGLPQNERIRYMNCYVLGWRHISFQGR